MKLTKKDHMRNLSDIMDSMPDDTCGDWRDSIAYAMDAIEKLDNDDKLDFAQTYKKIAVPLNLIESIKTVEVLEKMKEEMKKWYWDADVQSIAEDPCVVDAMISMFIRTANKYEENEVNKTMSIKDRAQSDIKISMSDDDCGDWKDCITHTIEVLKQAYNDCGGDDTSDNIDQRQKEFIAFIKENLNKGDDTGDNINQIIYQMKKEFIDKYPKNYMGGLELDGKSCEFSLNKVLEILDKYKKEI